MQKNCIIINDKRFFLADTAIYMDYQATSPIDCRVLEDMLPYMTYNFGNPHSSEHILGWKSNEAVNHAKEQVADYIGAISDEIIFTSGATESNNMAIIGLGYAALEKKITKKTILVSSIEHKCVLGAARFLTKWGFTIKKIPVTENGIVDIDALRKLINDDVLLISVMATNNEIGTNQPLKEIGKLCQENDILFHTDAAQGAYTDIDVMNIRADFMSLSGHKIYGPKGIGVLYINRFSKLKPLPIIYGGGQQDGYRSGTLPTFLAVGMGSAAQLMQRTKETEIVEISKKRDLLLGEIIRICPLIKINGSMNNRHPGNINVVLPDVDARQFIMSFQPNFCFSSGAACSSGIQEASHVLRAIGCSTDEADRSFRLAIGRYTEESDIYKFLDKFKQYYSK